MPEENSLSGSELKRALVKESRRLGFDAIGISRAERLSEEAGRLREWLAAGKHGTMRWMEAHLEKRIDPRELVPGAQSIISVIQNYYKPCKSSGDSHVGRISRYAWGDDYHDVMREGLTQLLDWLDRTGGAVSGRVFVDSAPVMDKAWAARAGIGWIGKHSNLINRSMGSWFFIGELIVDIELEPDHPVSDLCGSCTRCIEACPTDALNEPYSVDANLCISYLTIEHREDDFPDELQKGIGNWIFGCDICQDVCPWNKFSRPSTESRYEPRPGTLDSSLETWSTMDEETFQERFRKSPVKRTKWMGFQRNVRVAQGNMMDSQSATD